MPKPQTPQTIGQRLRAAREKAEMTQAELADESGVPQSTISEIESGGVREPKAAPLARLAAALDVTLADLVGV